MIEKHNFHWKEGFFYGFPIKRTLFARLAEELNTKQVVSVTGLRRTGKSTLLKQLADHLMSVEKTPRENILFYSFDEEQPKIEEIIKEYQARTAVDISKETNKIFIFLDEVQKLEGWQDQVKYYYDNYANIKFFISGSSSLFIRKHTRESLAGRIREFILPPLSFREYLSFRGKEDLAEKPLMFEDTLKTEFLQYQKRQFVEIISESEEKAGQYVQTLLEKVVYHDIPKVFPIGNEDLLMKILKIIAANPGMLSDYESLSKDLGISRVTLSNYFFYLEESFLIIKLYNFSANLLSSEKKMKRFYLSSTSFYAALNNDMNESKIVENLVVANTDAKYFWRTPQKYEVDVILESNGKITPIEVKYRNVVLSKEMKNLARFAEKFGSTTAFAITKDTFGKDEFEQRDGKKLNITLVPAWSYLLESRSFGISNSSLD
ncbi:MAG: ATP-binding protein [Candidatus Micrarchaeia archaeon]|jgi:hypothetical protein